MEPALVVALKLSSVSSLLAARVYGAHLAALCPPGTGHTESTRRVLVQAVAHWRLLEMGNVWGCWNTIRLLSIQFRQWRRAGAACRRDAKVVEPLIVASSEQSQPLRGGLDCSGSSAVHVKAGPNTGGNDGRTGQLLSYSHQLQVLSICVLNEAKPDRAGLELATTTHEDAFEERVEALNRLIDQVYFDQLHESRRVELRMVEDGNTNQDDKLSSTVLQAIAECWRARQLSVGIARLKTQRASGIVDRRAGLWWLQRAVRNGMQRWQCWLHTRQLQAERESAITLWWHHSVLQVAWFNWRRLHVECAVLERQMMMLVHQWRRGNAWRQWVTIHSHLRAARSTGASAGLTVCIPRLD